MEAEENESIFDQDERIQGNDPEISFFPDIQQSKQRVGEPSKGQRNTPRQREEETPDEFLEEIQEPEQLLKKTKIKKGEKKG